MRSVITTPSGQADASVPIIRQNGVRNHCVGYIPVRDLQHKSAPFAAKLLIALQSRFGRAWGAMPINKGPLIRVLHTHRLPAQTPGFGLR